MQAAFNLDNISSFSVYKNRNRHDQILALERKTVREYSLQHGDIVYLESAEPGGSNGANNNSVSTQSKSAANGMAAEEDEVDKKLWKMSGLIERPRDPKLCNHGANGKCLHCTPIEPYDEAYLKEHNIKHMSFHSYLRKMTRGIDR